MAYLIQAPVTRCDCGRGIRYTYDFDLAQPAADQSITAEDDLAMYGNSFRRNTVRLDPRTVVLIRQPCPCGKAG